MSKRCDNGKITDGRSTESGTDRRVVIYELEATNLMERVIKLETYDLMIKNSFQVKRTNWPRLKCTNWHDDQGGRTHWFSSLRLSSVSPNVRGVVASILATLNFERIATVSSLGC